MGLVGLGLCLSDRCEVKPKGNIGMLVYVGGCVCVCTEATHVDACTCACGRAHVCGGTRARVRVDARTCAWGRAHVCV